MGWDKGLDYETTYKLLVGDLDKERKRTGERALKRRLYLIILLTQLRNGSRIGEAIEFVHTISKEFRREAYIKVEKRQDGYRRLMVLPKEITKTDILVVKGLLEEELTRLGKRGVVIKISSWVKKRYSFNTHSLRYAFISYLARKGYPPQVISKITGHRRLDYILHYTQEIVAKEVLKNII